jgi:hypothetical protein
MGHRIITNTMPPKKLTMPVSRRIAEKTNQSQLKHFYSKEVPDLAQKFGIDHIPGTHTSDSIPSREEAKGAGRTNG